MAWALGWPFREPMRAISEKEYQRVKKALSCSTACCGRSIAGSLRAGHGQSRQQKEGLMRPHLAVSVPEGLSEAGKRNILFRFRLELEEESADDAVFVESPPVPAAESLCGGIARDSLFRSLDNLVLKSPKGPRRWTTGGSTSDISQSVSSCASPPVHLIKEESFDLSPSSEPDNIALGLTLVFVPDLETLEVKVLVPDSYAKDNILLDVTLLQTQSQRHHRQMNSQRKIEPGGENVFLFFLVGRTTKELDGGLLRFRVLLSNTYSTPEVADVATTSMTATDNCSADRQSTHVGASRYRSISESEYFIRIRNKNTQVDDGENSSSDQARVVSASSGRDNKRRSSRVLNAKEFYSDILRSRPGAMANPFGEAFSKILSAKIEMIRKKIFIRQQQESAVANTSYRKHSLLQDSSEMPESRGGEGERFGSAEDSLAEASTKEVMGEAVLRLEESLWMGSSASLRHTCRLQLLKPQLQPQKSLSARSQQQPDLGELHVLLQYQSKADRIKVVVVQASGLPPALFKPEDLVVLRLLHKDNVVAERRTCTRPGECPVWKESFPFSLAGNHLDAYSLQLVVMRRRLLASDHVIGHVTLGGNDGAEGTEPNHWEEMREAPEQEIARWHHISSPLT